MGALYSESGDFRRNARVDNRGGFIAQHSTWPPLRRGNAFRSLDRRYCGFDQLARPPSKQAPLAPFRDDVPLLDTCSGHVSAGSAVVLGITDRPGFLDSFHHVPSALWVPSGIRETPQTQSSLSTDMSHHDNAWNSRRITDSALRACSFGWNSAMKATQPPEKKIQEGVKMAIKHIVYTSATQRSYAEVDWDAKLPPRIKPPTTTLEKITDPMTGARENSCQRVPMEDIRKPISFCSPCRKSGQIPLYSGTIGSKNMDNIDDISGDFQPLTIKRTVIPAYTPTSYRAIIPGYAGMRVWANTGENAIPTQYTGATTDLRTPKFGHKSPLSRMVTIASKNPFMNPNISALPLK